jgi:predicted ATPase/class 3 adenylate cyclase/Tfp pilus assembly protein PilF
MPQPPTGTVTLVFTDIEGSTALWEHFGADFKPLLDQHNDIFRAAIEEFGGYEVKTEGDAFMVAFQDGAEAVAMCLAVQERLHAAHWPESLNDASIADWAGSSEDGLFRGLRVRMGAHVGPVDAQPDPVTGRMDYFGRTVNRAARVGAAGHGGQLVVSQATWELLDATAAEFVITDLGEHALKGLEHHEQLRQLLPASLAGRTFPRLNTPSLRTTNLPCDLDSFFGREQEISELQDRVTGGQRLITILGAGGTGKTRLGQRLGAMMLADFPGGVWFCDLCEARTMVGVLQAMGRALELPLTSNDPAAQLSNAILGRGQVLLILDNFEQVVEHAGETVGRWLQQAPDAVFLVTSRTLLRIAGEEAYYLDPLPVPEAVNLFFDRAASVQPGFVRTAQNEPVVEEIVRRLDCMSLAVELAAARVRMLSPQKILSRLSQRFKLLQGQRRDQTARQATLRGAIDWSWHLLKAYERAAMVQLSVFHGGCTLEAAEAVVDLDGFEEAPYAMDVVEALVDHSLLRRVELHPGQVRYRMLESIREYSAEKLADDAGAAALRHVSHFASYGDQAFIDSLSVHGGVEKWKCVTLELDNLVVGIESALAAGATELALNCALALAEVAYLRGPFSQCLELLERIAAQGVAGLWRVRLCRAKGNLLALVGRASEAADDYQEALSIAREVGERHQEGALLEVLAKIDYGQARVEEAQERYQQALALAREVGDGGLSAVVLSNLGILHRQQGRFVEALEYLQQSRLIDRAAGNRPGEGITVGNIAVVYFLQGQIPEALEHFEESLAIAREVGNRRSEGTALGSLATLHHNRGHLQEALEAYRGALEIMREMGLRKLVGINLGNLGDLLFEQGDLSGAETHLQQAIEICDPIRPAAAGAFRGSLALLRVQQGAIDEARALLDRGDTQLRGVHKLELGRLLCKRARVEHLAGAPATAAAALAEAEAIAVEIETSDRSDLGKALAEARALLSE